MCVSNHHPVFIGLVRDPIVELGVDGDLAANPLLHLAGVTLKEHHAVLIMPDTLLDLEKLSRAAELL